MKCLLVALSSFIFESFCLDQTMYKRTTNMSLSSWSSFATRTLKTRSLIQCASQCLYEKETCNAWHFESEEKSCQLGKVNFNRFERMANQTTCKRWITWRKLMEAPWSRFWSTWISLIALTSSAEEVIITWSIYQEQVKRGRYFPHGSAGITHRKFYPKITHFCHILSFVDN